MLREGGAGEKALTRAQLKRERNLSLFAYLVKVSQNLSIERVLR